jgi:uracil-DNA glycosylase
VDRTHRVAEATDHLISVARCPIVADCLAGRAVGHPCENLVLSQWPENVSSEQRAEAWPRWHQLPEPWLGHLRTARLLFVASNPGHGGTIPADRLAGHASEKWTTWERDDAEIISRSITFSFDNDVPYWRETRKRAVEVFGDGVRPGIDYALTEAVRCKSPGETEAVGSARGVCSRNYLRATILLSGARVVLGMGSHARIALTKVVPLDDGDGNYHETVVGERQFVVGFLPHPNARIPDDQKTLASNFDGEQLRQIRTMIACGSS